MSIKQAPLAGKRILVTGGTTGIGRATVALLAEEGARILTFGRNEPELQDSLENARSKGGEVYGLTADSATQEGIDKVFAAVDEQLGGIDILVANAALGVRGLDDVQQDEIRYVVETNLIGYLACAKAATERMKRDGGGHLLFISSISPDIEAPGESIYAGTKAAVIATAETLRKELSDKNIKVSVIQPGSVGTDMQPCDVEEQRQAIAENRMLYAEDIAESVLFVLTRSARTDIVTLRVEPLLQKTS